MIIRLLWPRYLAHALDQLLWRGIHGLDLRRDRRTRFRIDLEVALPRLIEQFGLLQRGVEGCAKRAHAICRRAGRRQEWTLEDLLADHQLDHGTILGRDVFPDLGHAERAQERLRLEPDLKQDVDLVRSEQAGTKRVHCG